MASLLWHFAFVLAYLPMGTVSLSSTLFQQSWHEVPLSTVYFQSSIKGDTELVFKIHGTSLLLPKKSQHTSKSSQNKSGPWTYEPICTDVLPGVGDKLCVYTDATFSNGRGISLFTTPKIASEVLRLQPFTNPSIFETHAINTNSGVWKTSFLPGRGIGLLATRPLPFKTRVTAYTPALLALLEQDLSTMDREKMFRLAIDQLPKETRDLYLGLSYVYGDERVRVQDIVQGNTFQMDLGGSNHLAVFPETSRLNHDCGANAQYYLDPELLTHFVHVVRPIAPGEEITISYTSPLESTAVRQQHLNQGFHFSCTCTRCSSAEKTDSTLQTIASLQKSLNDWSVNSIGTPKMAERLLQFYRKEKLEGFLDLPYGFAALAYNAVGETEKAVNFAEKAKEAILLKDGTWSANLWIWEELLKEPQKHWSFQRRLQ